MDSTYTFCCPITLDPFKEPVLAPCGHTFESGAIHEWLQLEKRCRLDNKPLDSNQLITNIFLKQIINQHNDFESDTVNVLFLPVGGTLHPEIRSFFLRFKSFTSREEEQSMYIPNIYKCHITKKIFLDPNTLPCGHTFEHSVIKSKLKCPLDKQPFLPNQIYKNFIAKEVVEVFDVKDEGILIPLSSQKTIASIIEMLWLRHPWLFYSEKPHHPSYSPRCIFKGREYSTNSKKQISEIPFSHEETNIVRCYF